MRALTLKPHWAHAVAHLHKRVENRSRPIPPALIGQRIAIHAGASLPKEWAKELLRAAPGSRVNDTFNDYYRVIVQPKTEGARLENRPHALIVKRAIVATARLAFSKPGLDICAPRFINWGDPDAAWWWKLEDVQTLERPIRVERGQLGLWGLPDSIVEELNA